MKPLPYGDVVAWKVEIHETTCICFAVSKSKAQMIATRSYWAAYGQRRGEWPGAVARRCKQYDNSPTRFETPQKAWGEDYVR